MVAIGFCVYIRPHTYIYTVDGTIYLLRFHDPTCNQGKTFFCFQDVAVYSTYFIYKHFLMIYLNGEPSLEVRCFDVVDYLPAWIISVLIMVSWLRGHENGHDS